MVQPSKISSSDAVSQVILSRKEYDELMDQNQKLQRDNLYLHHELDKLKRMIFGTKSERFAPSDPSQLSMELSQSVAAPVEPQTEEITYTRQKQIRPKAMPAWRSQPPFPARPL
jgi:hypothetical protein